MRRILITGCNGLLGQKLFEKLNRPSNTLFGIDLGDDPLIKIDNYIQQDLTKTNATISLIKEISPDVIVHAASMTNVDRCEIEKDACWKGNVTTTESICKGAKRVNSRIIYISTDYIFDGQSGPYGEEDLPNPINYYGKSKLAGENLVRGSQVPNTIVRTIVLYGYGKQLKSSFISWLLGELRKSNKVRIVNDQWGNTTLVDDLGDAIDRTIDLSYTGIVNVGGTEFLTRYELARIAAEVFNLDSDLIVPISTTELNQRALRPVKSGLIVEKAIKELDLKLHDVSESLEIYKQQEASANL